MMSNTFWQKIPGAWRFFVIVVSICISFLLFNGDVFREMIYYAARVLLNIIPIFLLVFVLSFLGNYFLSSQSIAKNLNRKKTTKWVFVILGGILSMGPIYMWYPLLAELRGKLLSDGMVACFLYNRAIKLPLLPMAIFYFGWRYVAVLSFVMIGASIFQGFIMNRIMGGER